MKLSTKSVNKEQRILDDAWSTHIKAKGEWRCAICGSDIKVAAHHIIPRENREIRYNELNGIPLCISHHKFNRIISAHNNPLAFYLWLAKYRPEIMKWVEITMRKLLYNNGIEV